MAIQAIILAAGQGTRMKSKLPKVLHRVSGKSMLQHVLDNGRKSLVDQSTVVIGKGAELVRESLPKNVNTVVQKEQLGTGHAVMVAIDEIQEEGITLVLYGDAPLIRGETLDKLMAYHSREVHQATVLTAELDEPYGYGRIIRDQEGLLARIVEERDAKDQERAIKEINSGIYCFDSKELKNTLPKLDNNNAQGEYYLTDVLEILKNEGKKVGAYITDDYEDIMAVNSRVQLAEVQKIMNRRIMEKHMENGVTVINPENTYIEEAVAIGRDTIIEPGVMLKGKTVIGEDVTLKANSVIENSQIADRVTVESSTIKDAVVGEESTIGPYAFLRPKSTIGKRVKIGDFVEVKNSVIGDDSKASHLAYIGDADIGKDVNIGCGVIFVNYDGEKKHRSTIKDHAFIGSNSNIVAPITVEEYGYVACGSNITKKVPKGALAIERGEQHNIDGWVKKKFKNLKEEF